MRACGGCGRMVEDGLAGVLNVDTLRLHYCASITSPAPAEDGAGLQEERRQFNERIRELVATRAVAEARAEALQRHLERAQGAEVDLAGLQLAHEALKRENARLLVLLHDVACSGVEMADPRIDYVTVQMDTTTWGELAPYRAALAPQDAQETGK